MRNIELPQVWLELARLLTTRHKFVCFGVTSSVDIDCARSSLCQVRQFGRESIGTEIRGSWVRVPRETDFIIRSPPEVFSKKDAVQIRSNPTGEQPRRSVSSTKPLCNFIEITTMRECTPENLKHTRITPLPRRIPLGDCSCMSKEF